MANQLAYASMGRCRWSISIAAARRGDNIETHITRSTRADIFEDYSVSKMMSKMMSSRARQKQFKPPPPNFKNWSQPQSSPSTMSPSILFNALLPICMHPPPRPATPSTKTPLSCLLTHSNTQLSLTISDLTHRLLLLLHTQHSATFPSAHTPPSLTVDFSAYPTLLAKYLTCVQSDSNFVAYLQVDEGKAVLTIIEFEHGYNTTRIQLELVCASESQIIAELAGRARRVEQLVEEVAALRRETEGGGREREALRRTVEEQAVVVGTADGWKRQLDAVTAEMALVKRELEGGKEELSVCRQELERVNSVLNDRNNGREALETRLTTLTTANNTATSNLQSATTRLQTALLQRDEAASQIRKGNEIISTLQQKLTSQAGALKTVQSSVRAYRAKNRAKDAIIARQEDRVAALQRECRRASDRVQLLSVEKEGLVGRLNSVQGKLEENVCVIESDQHVIRYLNRQLNDRLLSEVSEGSGGKDLGGAQPV